MPGLTSAIPDNFVRFQAHPDIAQATRLALLLLILATGTAHGTFIEDIDLPDISSATSIFNALLTNKTCTLDYSKCPSKFAIEEDKTSGIPGTSFFQCFTACTSAGGACRACCEDGFYYKKPSSGHPLGACIALSPKCGPTLWLCDPPPHSVNLSIH
jgi:hypothetical protein